MRGERWLAETGLHEDHAEFGGDLEDVLAAAAGPIAGCYAVAMDHEDSWAAALPGRVS
jgi:hypothetical protein